MLWSVQGVPCLSPWHTWIGSSTQNPELDKRLRKCTDGFFCHINLRLILSILYYCYSGCFLQLFVLKVKRVKRRQKNPKSNKVRPKSGMRKKWKTPTHVDESCVLLVNLHQLLVCFVPHAGLWVCSHCNEVGYTLHRQDKSSEVHMHMHFTSVHEKKRKQIKMKVTSDFTITTN